MLHLALDHAVRRGLIARNPVEQTDPPSRETKPAQTLTPEQLNLFLNDSIQTAPIYLSALYLTKGMTGMRFGELLGLREADIDLENGVLHVEQTLKRPGPKASFGKPKTPRSRRTMTLSVEVVEALRQARKWKVEQKLRRGPKFKEYGLVFCLPSGKPLNQNNIRRRDFYPRLERLNLPRIRPHDLRHTHGTQLIAAGVDPRTVADRLGHSSPAFTMTTYVHGVSESQRRAAEVATKLRLIPTVSQQ
jgi:integrase